MSKPMLIMAAAALLLAACGERARERQAEMANEAATNLSVATTAIPENPQAPANSPAP
jgi:hypothetical protein